MGPQSTGAQLRRLPLAVLATFAVVGFPVLAVSLLRASGALTGIVPLIAAGTALSLVASYLGAALWAARGRSGDTVFGDLMLWGWLRRWRMERQLASAAKLLGPGAGPDTGWAELSSKRRARLLRRLAGALEARDPYTHGHSRRVARHAAAIAKRMGLGPEQAATVRAAAAVHDVGKLETPERILRKAGKLTEAEFAAIREHPVAGAKMVAGLGDGRLVEIVRHHHERLDGKGYPDGLTADRIPIGARIVAVADTFDALTSARPYRAAKSHREALDVLAAEAGTQLDADAVRAFRGYYSGLRAVALWAFAVNVPRQFLVALPERIRLGQVGLTTKMTATAATAAATVAAGGAAVEVLAPPPESPVQARNAAAVLGPDWREGRLARLRAAAGARASSPGKARASLAVPGAAGARTPSAPVAFVPDPKVPDGDAEQPGGDASPQAGATKKSGSAGRGSPSRQGDVSPSSSDQGTGTTTASGRKDPPAGKGGPLAEKGGPPADKGGPPADKGGPPADKGGPPAGKGGPPAGKGGPPADKGGPPADKGGKGSPPAGPPGGPPSGPPAGPPGAPPGPPSGPPGTPPGAGAGAGKGQEAAQPPQGHGPPDSSPGKGKGGGKTK